MEVQSKHAAKYAFFYLLSLVGLGFTAVSSGMIVFQIINKFFVDPLAPYDAIFDSGVLRFAISSIIIAAPIYYVLMWQINKSIKNNDLPRDSAIRKWLTYLIIFISSVVILGYLIGIINTFLNGDLTTKFALKALTALVISAIVFSYYFIDIKTDEAPVGKNMINLVYFYGSVALVALVFISALFMVDSPQTTRDRRFDSQVISNFEQIFNTLDAYYNDNNKLPKTLDELTRDKRYVVPANSLKEPGATKEFDYKIIKPDTFQLCANFKTSNKDPEGLKLDEYFGTRWPHDAGYQCLEQVVKLNDIGSVPGKIVPAPITN